MSERSPGPWEPDQEQGGGQEGEPSTTTDAHPGPRREWGVYLFLALLVGFNLFVFFGSGGAGDSGGGGEQAVAEGAEGPPPPVTVLPPGVEPEETDEPASGAIPLVAPPSPEVHYEPPPSPPPLVQYEAPPSPPPPPPGEGEEQGVGGGLGGPELLLGIAALAQSPEHGLSAAQKQALLPLLARLEEPRGRLRALTVEALACLTEEQVQWMRARRGPVEVDPTGAEPGMDPVSSAALALLRAKGGATEEEAATRKHEAPDMNFHDLLHGILRLEKEGGALALSPAQARALAGKVLEGSRIQGEETALFGEIGAGLSPAQREHLEANPELVRLDVNALTLRYVRAALEP